MAERKSVSMQDLADQLGISKVTVSKALNGKDGVGEELKEKIFALARESGYVLPDYGKRRSKKVGIIMSPRFSFGDEENFIWRCTSGSSTNCRKHPARAS